MQLYFIRHAQSENNLLYIRTGSNLGRSSDPELTDLGQQQAASLAKFLSTAQPAVPQETNGLNGRFGLGISHLYCSLMVRAVSTGSAVARALNLPLRGWEVLHEAGGIFQTVNEVTGEKIGLPGHDAAYFKKNYPLLSLPDTMNGKGWWNRPFEEQEQRLPRAKLFISELLSRHGGTGDRVAVISHGGFYNYFLRALLELPLDTKFHFNLNNTGITRIDFEEEDYPQMIYSNRTDFLPLEQFSR